MPSTTSPGNAQNRKPVDVAVDEDLIGAVVPVVPSDQVDGCPSIHPNNRATNAGDPGLGVRFARCYVGLLPRLQWSLGGCARLVPRGTASPAGPRTNSSAAMNLSYGAMTNLCQAPPRAPRRPVYRAMRAGGAWQRFVLALRVWGCVAGGDPTRVGPTPTENSVGFQSCHNVEGIVRR